MVADSLPADDVEVVAEPPPDPPKVWADGGQFGQVVATLVSNAHRALRERQRPRRLVVATRWLCPPPGSSAT